MTWWRKELEQHMMTSLNGNNGPLCGESTGHLCYGHFISTMGFPVPVRWHRYIESGPWIRFQLKKIPCFRSNDHLDFDLGIPILYPSNTTCYSLLFTKRTEVLVKSRRFGFGLFQSLSKFDRHFDSSAAKMPVKLESDAIIIISSLAASILHDILG